MKHYKYERGGKNDKIKICTFASHGQAQKMKRPKIYIVILIWILLFYKYRKYSFPTKKTLFIYRTHVLREKILMALIVVRLLAKKIQNTSELYMAK